jgi:hypothetical protein
VLPAILSGVSNNEHNLAEKGISTGRNMTIGEISLGFQQYLSPSQLVFPECPSHRPCETFSKKRKKWSGKKWSEGIEVRKT